MPAAADFLRELVRVGPDRGDHRVATRASLSVLVPLLVLAAVGRLDWSIYATFGAFTSLYGRDRVHPARTRMQLTLAGVLTGVVGLGVAVGTLEERRWVAVVVAALVAGLASLASDAQGWHPPGPLFPVFAFGATASIESTPADVLTAVLVAGASALLAVVVGNAGAAYRGRRRPHEARRTPVRAADFGAVARRHVARCAVAALVAGAIATGLGIGHPYWAVVGAVVPLAARHLLSQLVRGAHRLVGTGLGLVVAALLLWIDPTGLPLIVVIVVLQGVAELLVGRNYALALVAVTPLALLVGHLAAPSPAGPLLRDRAVETVIGVAVGVLVGWLTRDRRSAAPA
jgi:uncharacterized membrane protein YccC